MHGLIFKTKESHRQDQSESFVIYVEQQDTCTQMYVYMLSFSLSQQVKWNHFIMTSVFSTSIEVDWLLFALFHRDETKPTHIIGINSFLFFIQLIYKHSSPNYQHMISSEQLINKMLVFYVLCAYVETFSTAFTSLPVVMLFMQLIRVSCDISIYDEHRKVDEAASTNFFSHHTQFISHC
jgi:hypothetical protein